METKKWLWRLGAATVSFVAGSYFYKKFREGPIGLPEFLFRASAPVVASLALVPSHQYEVQEAMSRMERRHLEFKSLLDDLCEDFERNVEEDLVL